MYLINLHSFLPIPLAPDPIRVQTCVCCLFWTNRDCMAVTYTIYLIIQLEIWIFKSALTVNGNFYWNYSAGIMQNMDFHGNSYHICYLNQIALHIFYIYCPRHVSFFCSIAQYLNHCLNCILEVKVKEFRLN